MSLTISVEPELEAWLREEAARRGETPEELIAREVALRWTKASKAFRLPMREVELLKTINGNFSESFWDRYRRLIARRRDETLTEQERQELIALSDQVEEKTLERTEALIALAQLRGVTLDVLCASLGIAPISVVQ